MAFQLACVTQSRATELVCEFPPHVAAEWLGHSTLVAQKHNWQVTDSDFERASGPTCTSPSTPSETTTQNPTQ